MLLLRLGGVVEESQVRAIYIRVASGDLQNPGMDLLGDCRVRAGPRCLPGDVLVLDMVGYWVHTTPPCHYLASRVPTHRSPLT